MLSNLSTEQNVWVKDAQYLYHIYIYNLIFIPYVKMCKFVLDAAINKELDVWKQQIDKFANRILGTTNVVLSKDECYSAECNLGNFVTDAMVDYVSKYV